MQHSCSLFIDARPFAEADLGAQVWAIWREQLHVSVPAAWAALGVMILLLCCMRTLQSARSLLLLLR